MNRSLKETQTKLETLYKEVISLTNDYLLPNCKTADLKVFLLKMRADYQRYICEIIPEERREQFQNQAFESYKQATELNFSVFYFEVLEDRDLAIKVAKEAFDEAVS